jgi:hypothetical protein
MTSRSDKSRSHTVLGDYGFARARDIAFDAVLSLWEKRRKEGMKQSDLAVALNRDPGWISNQLRGPGNWTLRTFGELVEAMNGEVEIKVSGKEEPYAMKSNFDAYRAAMIDPNNRISTKHNFKLSVPSLPSKATSATSIVKTTLHLEPSL